MFLRFNKKNRNIFEAIRDGRKRVETRAATSKYADVKAGEIATFSCDGETFTRTITAVRHFPSVTALLKKYKVPQIHPPSKTAADLRAVYASFPGYAEKIRTFGLVAMELAAPKKKICSRGHVFFGSGPCPVCWPGRLKKRK
jgi:ASC-1-like (ASCH) protein